MDSKTCCVTGYRNIPANKINYVKHELHREIQAAIEDGYTRFISGFADGADLLFAAIIAEEKQRKSDSVSRSSHSLSGPDANAQQGVSASPSCL